MILTHLLTNTVVINRLANIPGTNKMVMTTVTAEVSVCIQPQAFEGSVTQDGVYGKQFVLYYDGEVSILQGDQLRDESDNIYTVKNIGVTRRSQGNISYSKLIIELND